MAAGIIRLLKKKYPQNYVIKNPFIGTFILLLICIGFIIIYKPLGLSKSRFLGYELTMVVYFFVLLGPLIGVIKILKSTNYFSDAKEWTLIKEIISILIILFVMGIGAYFAAFLLENPENRWNLSTFFDSLLKVFKIGIVPLLFFTFIKYPYLITTDIVQNYTPNPLSPADTEELIHIISQLKKEELSFYPSQLIYAESDGNYVVFYLEMDNQLKKRIVRNSISNVEQQLSTFTFIMRTHRAFIINMNKIKTKKGNSLGYHLLLLGTDAEIPVSRQKTRDFDRLLKQRN